jgi:hypothetical protein
LHRGRRRARVDYKDLVTQSQSFLLNQLINQEEDRAVRLTSSVFQSQPQVVGVDLISHLRVVVRYFVAGSLPTLSSIVAPPHCLGMQGGVGAHGPSLLGRSQGSPARIGIDLMS